jgi:hypothetical protein
LDKPTEWFILVPEEKSTMTIDAKSAEEYISKIPEDRQPIIRKLREVILSNLPGGFEEVIQYGMISYVVPHSVYPDGYHVDPKVPLPFMSIASQKNFIALYHSGVYTIPELKNWFVAEYPKFVKTKLDMGKSCIRFKNVNTIPFELIGELTSKITSNQWVNAYENVLKK